MWLGLLELWFKCTITSRAAASAPISCGWSLTRAGSTLIEGLAHSSRDWLERTQSTVSNQRLPGWLAVAVIMAGHKVLQHGQEGMVFAARACDRDP